MADLDLVGQIRVAMAAKLGELAGVQTLPYLKSLPTPPTVWVFPGGPGDISVEYHRAMRDGAEDWQFTVQAFVGVMEDESAQKTLDAMLASTGEQSVKARLEAEQDLDEPGYAQLGGLVEDLTVVSATGYRPYQLPAVPNALVLGCEWFVDVMAPGT